MSEPVVSPACRLPKNAITVLDQGSVDDILREGAFAEMAHLPLAAVLGQAWGYAEALLEAQKEGTKRALADPMRTAELLDLALLADDARFVSQVIALRDLATVHGVAPQADAEEGISLGQAVEGAVTQFVQRATRWAEEPGRASTGFRVQKGSMGELYPIGIHPAGSPLGPAEQPDLFAVFVGLPLVAPFILPEEDCFVEPRLV